PTAAAEPRPTRTQPRTPRAKAELEAARAKVESPTAKKPGLLHRVARGLKSLVTRGPRSQH
ncbi:MAG TPA: hypothetical protein VIG88_09100, partial [Lysobacter sp.]